MKKINNFFQYKGFISYLMDTKKYREIYKGETALLSAALSLIFVIIMCMLKSELNAAALTIILHSVLSLLIPSLIGMLGFLITGLALLASIVTQEAIKNIDKEGKVGSLAGILYSFYFEGAMVGFNIFLMLILYYILAFPSSFIDKIFFVSILLTGYTFCFSLIYSINLLGSCINFFFMNLYHTSLGDD